MPSALIAQNPNTNYARQTKSPTPKHKSQWYFSYWPFVSGVLSEYQSKIAFSCKYMGANKKINVTVRTSLPIMALYRILL